MQPLYDIANKYQYAIDLITSSDEICDEYKDMLNNIEADLKDKAVNIGAMIQNLEAEEHGIDEAIQKMQDRQEKLMKKTQWLRDYLKEHLEKCKVDEVKSPYFDIRIKLNPASVVVEDESLVPMEYFRESVVRRLDKATMAQDLKNNAFIPGVHLERRTRLEIK
jgi:ribosome recycling factor